MCRWSCARRARCAVRGATPSRSHALLLGVGSALSRPRPRPSATLPFALALALVPPPPFPRLLERSLTAVALVVRDRAAPLRADAMARNALRAPAAMATVWRMVRQVASGLDHIHSHGMLHCDVKPDNILIDGGGGYKLGDLGQATFIANWNEHEGDAKYLAKDLLEYNPR